MAYPHFFGYGSLVNTATHSYPDPVATRLTGWRRMWRHTTWRDVAYLTAVPDPNCEIDGLIAKVPNNDWAALDLREFAYTRQVLNPATFEADLVESAEVQIYQTRSDSDTAPSVKHAILLSYLDVVVQGYAQVFGKAGVERFFKTTSGWDAPIRNDRSNPLYPRHQKLTPAETALVDQHLAALSAHVQ